MALRRLCRVCFVVPDPVHTRQELNHPAVATPHTQHTTCAGAHKMDTSLTAPVSGEHSGLAERGPACLSLTRRGLKLSGVNSQLSRPAQVRARGHLCPPRLPLQVRTYLDLVRGSDTFSNSVS